MKRVSKNKVAGWLICIALGELSGCSSVMTHTGSSQGYYSGTQASSEVLLDDESSWVMKPLAAIDLPFSAVLDTLLLPWDYYRADKADSLHERIRRSEQHNQTDTWLAEAAPMPSLTPLP